MALADRAADERCAPRRRPAETAGRACSCRRQAAGAAPARAAVARSSAAGRSSSCRRSRAAARRSPRRRLPTASAPRSTPTRLTDRSSRRPRFRNRQPWPRVMFSISMPLNAARSVMMRFRCDEHVLELDAALPQAHVLMQLVQDPPGVDRQPIAHGAGEAPHLVQRIAEARVRACLAMRSIVSSSSLRSHGVRPSSSGSTLQADEHLQQRRDLPRIVGRILIGQARRRSCAAAGRCVRRVRRSARARRDSRRRGSAARSSRARAGLDRLARAA